MKSRILQFREEVTSRNGGVRRHRQQTLDLPSLLSESSRCPSSTRIRRSPVG